MASLTQLLRERPPGFGGVERTAHELAQIFNSGDVYCLCNPPDKFDPISVSYKRWCLHFFSIGRLRIPLPKGHFWALLRSSQPLHGHLPSPAVLVMVLFLHWLQPQRSLSLHWHAFLQGSANSVYQFIALLVLRWQQFTVVTTSPVLKEALICSGLHPQQIKVLPCCLSSLGEILASKQAELRQQRIYNLDSVPSVLHIICIGRLDSYKRIDWVIEALALCGTEFKLSVIGDGPDRARLELLAIESSVEHSCKFFGQLSEEQKFDLLGTADLLVLASDNCHEAFGIVQLEAMACGVPSLALAFPRSGANWVSALPAMPLWRDPGSVGLAEALRSFSDDRELIKLASQQAKDRYEKLFCRRLWQQQLLSLELVN